MDILQRHAMCIVLQKDVWNCAEKAVIRGRVQRAARRAVIRYAVRKGFRRAQNFMYGEIVLLFLQLLFVAVNGREVFIAVIMMIAV